MSVTVEDFRGSIQWIVDRFHVSTKNSEIVRDLYRRFRRSEGADLEKRNFWTRERRKQAYRIAIARHEANGNV